MLFNDLGRTKMSIRNRIILLVLLTLAALGSIGGYSVVQARLNAAEVRNVTDVLVPSAMASADLVSALKETQLALVAVVYAPDANLVSQAMEKLAGLQAGLKEQLESQAQQATSDTQRGLVVQSRESLDNYFNEVNQVVSVKKAGQSAMAEALLYANVAQYQRELEEIVETLRVEKNRSKDAAVGVLNESLADAISMVSVVSILALFVLGFIGMMLYRRVVRPITSMQQKMSEIAENQDFSHRLPVESQDEIGRSITAFNVMIAKIQESSGLIRQKNDDIQALLQNLPQGVLSIVGHNQVHQEYSRYLETILETTDIAGRNVIDLVFSDTTIGADALAQTEAAIGACLGEDVMNFEFNEHLMVTEIHKQMANGESKVIDLDWSPITDEQGLVRSLLLSLRDVTELRKLAAEAQSQKRELEIIGEVLAVSQEKFHEFINTALKFVDENEQLIRDHVDLDPGVVTQLFRNMHTVKGNARTYALRHLTNTVHLVEQTYDELRQPRPALAWDQTVLQSQLADVRKEIEHYAYVNEVSLGRKGPGRRGNDRYLLVDREQIRETLERLETVNTANLHELVSAQASVRRVLRLLGAEPIARALSGVFDSLPSLASELGKLPPVIEIDDGGYCLRNQVVGTVKNVFMHLVRNAMDHGIESPEVGQGLGKALAGSISLAVEATGEWLCLKLADDGRGLALKKIREQAISKGLIAADESLADEAIAQLIFKPGFSTAEKVTEVSGRGVGMDAVQDFIRRENGSIQIELIEGNVGSDFRPFQMVIRLPVSVAVHAEEPLGGAAEAAVQVHQLGKSGKDLEHSTQSAA